MIKATDDQLLELIKKYKDQITKKFNEAASDYQPTESVKEVDILDFVLGYVDDDMLEDVVSNIEDSIGMEELGYEEVD